MAQFQSEIELRVKVNDKELRDLEKRAEKIQNTNPFSASGAGRGQTAQQNRVAQAALRTDQKRLQLQQQIKQGQIRELQDAAKLTRLFKDAAVVKASYAKDSERAAKAVQKEAAAAQKVAAANKKARTQKIQGAGAGGVISAAFPVLTGGSAAESALGGIGGLLGSAFGPLGSFAGGIGGSALGRLITDAEELNKSLARLNTSIGAVGTTSQITGDDLGKLASQLGLAKDETITLIEQFNGLAVAADVAALARDFGNVGGAATAEAIAVAAQSEADALSAIEKLRGTIGLEAAKQLQDTLEQEGLQVSLVAILAKTLELSEAKAISDAKQVGFAETMLSLWTAIRSKYEGVDVFRTPQQIADDRVAGLQLPDGKDRLGNLRDFLEQQRRLREQYKPQKTPRGRTGGALPQSKELQLRQQILKTELAVANIQGKRAALFLTDLEAVRAKEQLLAASLVKETQILELARQQALTNSKVPEDNALINELYDDRLKKIQAQNFLLREQNGLAEKNILLQRDLVALRNEQQTEDIVKGLGRGIEDANSRSSSEMLALRIKQLRRQEDLIGGINDKLAEQKLIEAGSDATKAAAATREIGFLEDRKEAIEALLPALNQAEQQQLRFNQAFAAVTPAVNSLVGGLREVVAGTKTAEEAFADFLNTIADQLINTAATMIAQYIAIGIARMFAGLGGNPGGGSSGFNLSGGGSSVGSGGLPGIDSLGGLFNGSMPFIGSGRAGGGPVSGGSAYMVGEQGPELFIPGVSGSISNNDQFEAARNALSDGSAGDAFDENGEALSNSSSSISNQGGNSSSSSSSSVGGNTSNYFGQNGEALAAISRSFSENNNSLATSSSYMRESAMERERQTTVGSGGSMTIETQVINSVEYATVEQVAIASAASAKQARAQVFSDMKNKPSRRAAVGLR